MTDQETFDFVCTKIIEQGEPSYDPLRGECRYRYAGLKCAAGHLIPDDNYLPEMEGVRVCAPRVAHVLSGYNLNLVESLQWAHDGSAEKPEFVGAFKARARETARRYNLSPTVLGAE